QHLFALANVVGNGMPALPADVDWPSSGFFALLSPQALQAVTAYAVDQLGPITYSDKKYGKLGSSAQFTLTAKLARPSIALKGTDLAITFVPNTSINASANWGITIGIGYDIKITPNPTATASIYAQERSIHINCNRVSEFKVELKPTGNVSQKFLSWAVEYIATRASNELGPMLVQYMTQFAYKVFPIPTLTQQIDSTVVTLTPTISAVENVQGNLGFLGSFDIS
ncbi:MAG TPA: hypothetical protein VFG99_04900, partial [Chloroflexia bacterium]|nr:hypothetical protein [Chloroflexia bacterium]